MSLPGARPSRGLSLGVVLLTLLGLIAVGRLAATAWLDRPTPDLLPEVGATTGEARPFCMVVLDGLREQAFRATDPEVMPWLRAFAAGGASGIAWAGDPTLTAPCVRALLTGRAPDLVTGLNNFDARPVGGSLVEYLRDRGAHTAHAGDATIFQFCRSHYDPADVLAIPDRGPTDLEGDDLATRFALERIAAGADVLTFHLMRPDHTGHMWGASGPEYLAACRQTDVQSRTVVEAFLARHPEALVLVAADHGVSPMGSHGGGETAARRAPFVLVGPGVAQVAGVEVSQFSLAPTIAGLLGLPLTPLADAPPAPELMDLAAEDELHVLDAYIQARLAVARSLGVEAVDPIERRRAAVLVRSIVGEEGEPYRLLAAELNEVLDASSALHAALALALACIWLATLVHLVSVDRVPSRRSRVACVAYVLSFPFVGLFLSSMGAAVLVLVLCIAAWVLLAPERPRGAVAALAGLAILPLLASAGLFLSSAIETSAGSDAGRTRLLIAGLVLLLAAATCIRPRPLWERAVALFRRAPGLVCALGGLALGFTLTLRPFVTVFVDLRIIFAAVGLGVVGAMMFSPTGRRQPRGVRLALGLLAVVLFVAPRVADYRLQGNWLEFVARRDTLWLLAGAAVVALLPLALIGRRIARVDLPGLLLALLALAGAYAVRLEDYPLPLLARGTNLLGLGALVLTLVRGTPDGRLLVRLLAAVALARRLTALDGEFLAFALFALGAALAARFPVPRTRLGLAWLAVGVLAIRTAVHHAMGGVESFSTVDVAAGFVGMDVTPVAAGADGGTVTWPIIEATIQLSLRFCLPWVVLLAAAQRALGRAAATRGLLADLAVTYAARGATITLALWALCRHAWWVEQARAVYALGAAEVVLLLAAGLLVGAFARESASGRGALPLVAATSAPSSPYAAARPSRTPRGPS